MNQTMSVILVRDKSEIGGKTDFVRTFEAYRNRDDAISRMHEIAGFFRIGSDQDYLDDKSLIGFEFPSRLNDAKWLNKDRLLLDFHQSTYTLFIEEVKLCD